MNYAVTVPSAQAAATSNQVAAFGAGMAMQQFSAALVQNFQSVPSFANVSMSVLSFTAPQVVSGPARPAGTTQEDVSRSRRVAYSCLPSLLAAAWTAFALSVSSLRLGR